MSTLMLLDASPAGSSLPDEASALSASGSSCGAVDDEDDDDEGSFC